ncbi:MAG: C1A family cysteine protease, partial [bacterium]
MAESRVVSISESFSRVASYGKNRIVGGYIPSQSDNTSKTYEATKFKTEELPPKVDLRTYMTQVENQGEVGSCTANAMAGAYEYLAKRFQKHDGDVSRLFLYYNARSLDGSENKDCGSTITDCVKVLKTHGICSEKKWKYDPRLTFKKPSADCYEEARKFVIKDAEMVPNQLDLWRHALA